MIKQTLRVPLHIIYIIYLCSRLYERRTHHTTLIHTYTHTHTLRDTQLYTYAENVSKDM